MPDTFRTVINKQDPCWAQSGLISHQMDRHAILYWQSL